MITAADLKSRTVKDLGQMAKSKGVAGWHAMRKDELVSELVKIARRNAKKQAKAKAASAGKKPKSKKKASNGHISATNGRKSGSSKSKVAPAKSPNAARIIRAAQQARGRLHDLSGGPSAQVANKDRVVLLVRDPYWLHACWEVTRQSVERAKAAMAEHWHTARPTLRLYQIESGPTTSTSEKLIRDIEVHGGVRNWYIDVADPPAGFRVVLGYLCDNGRFHAIARSNLVTTPTPGSGDSVDGNWSAVAENFEKVYSMSGGYNEDSASGELQELFEERLRRPMGPGSGGRFGMGAERLIHRDRELPFEVDAEMIIFGATSPDAHVTLEGEPIKLRPDGTFTVRRTLPDRRQVLPVVAATCDGAQQRTVVLAIERNTKVMEPVTRDTNM